MEKLALPLSQAPFRTLTYYAFQGAHSIHEGFQSILYSSVFQDNFLKHTEEILKEEDMQGTK